MASTEPPERLADYAELEQRLGALDLCSVARWLLDDERGRIPWANTAGQQLFTATSRSELAARDMSGFSAASAARFQQIRSDFRAGREVWETWTLYPKGEPKKIKAHSTPFTLVSGRVVLFIEGFPIENPEVPSESRGIEALRHTAAMVTMLDGAGELLLKNPSAVSAFEATPFADWFADPAVTAAIFGVLDQEEAFRTTALAHTTQGDRWHLVQARRLLDPVSGKLLILLDQIDITVQKLQALTIERQHEEIRALSAPLLPIGAHTLALPLIGAFDSERAAWLTEKVLTEISARRIRHVIIDLTGIGTLDSSFAQHLARLIQAVGLLGAQPLLTGVMPALAKLLVSAGIEFGGVVVCRDLQQAIARCAADG